MTETYEHKKITPIRGLLYVLCIVAAVFIVWVIARLIVFLTHINYIDLVLFVLCIAGGTMIVKYQLQNYVYTVDAKQITAERLLGDRKKLLAMVRIEDLLWVGEYSDLPAEYKGTTFEKVTFQKKKEAKALVYRISGRKDSRGVIFSPSSQFFQMVLEKKAHMEMRKEREAQYAQENR